MAAAPMEIASRHVGMIGPNAITRIAEALDKVESPQSLRRIFMASGLDAYLAEQPTEMVDEHEVMRLHQVLHDELGDRRARGVGRIAGQLTADYLLQCRIPPLAQTVLRYCPSGVASRALASAIAKTPGPSSVPARSRRGSVARRHSRYETVRSAVGSAPPSHIATSMRQRSSACTSGWSINVLVSPRSAARPWGRRRARLRSPGDRRQGRSS